MDYRKAAGAVMLALLLSGCIKTDNGDVSEEVKTTGVYAEKTSASEPQTEQLETEGHNKETETGNIRETEEETEPAETQKPSETEIKRPDVLYVLEKGRTLEDSVSQINTRTIRSEGSGVVDIFSRICTKEDTAGLITGYSFPELPLLDERAITDDDKKRILDNRNLEGIYSKVNYSVSYGIVLNNADVRSFPTDQRLTNGEIKENWDYFQETLLLAGEGVLVLHKSKDGCYSFVQGSNYCGWVRSELIMECSRTLLEAVLCTSDFAVVTEGYIELAAGDKKTALRMGTALPAVGENVLLLPSVKEEADSYLCLLEGSLVCCEMGDETGEVIYTKRISVDSSSVSRGYLPMNEEEIRTLMDKLTGCSYSWGDENGGYDCSSSIGSLYRCFGIILPRNSSQMGFSGTKAIYFTDMTEEEKYGIISSCPAGTILYVPGHVMMYDGAGGLFHCVTGYRTSDGTTHEPYSFVHTPLDILTRGDDTYAKLMKFAVVF